MADLTHVKGLAELQKMLDTLPAKIEKNIMRSAMRAGAKVFADEAKQNVPVASGALRDGIKVGTRARGGQVRAYVRTSGKHASVAHLVEFGTRAHLIKAKDGAMLFGGHFVESVQHPGAKPHAFMRPAFDARSTEAVVAVGEQIKKRLTKEGIDASDVLVEGDA